MSSSFHKWFQLYASKLVYTVTDKKWEDSQYWVRIRFKNTVKPVAGWIKLSDLRASAFEV